MTFDPKEIEQHLNVNRPEDIINFYTEMEEIKGALAKSVSAKNTAAVLEVVGKYRETIEKYANKDSTREVAGSEIPHLNYFTEIADAMYAVEAAALILNEGNVRKALAGIAAGKENLGNLYSKIRKAD